MRKILRFLKRIWIFNFFRRIYTGSRYFNKKYLKILKWGFTSKEDTNYTYHITEESITYLAHTIAAVTKVSYSQIIKYIREVQADEMLRLAIQTAIENSSEKRYADKEVRFGRRLGWYAFARVLKPKIIVETGVDKGLGSVLLCAALLKNKEEGFGGRYYGTDINPKAGYLLGGKYLQTGEILFGDSIQSLSKFTEKIDLFINDSDHSAEYEYQEYLTIKPLITDRTIILGDNSHCTSKLADFSLETDRRFIFYKEIPLNHWYPGAGIGISYKEQQAV
jgi:predicted O-methyltransferase YrrM